MQLDPASRIGVCKRRRLVYFAIRRVLIIIFQILGASARCKQVVFVICVGKRCRLLKSQFYRVFFVYEMMAGYEIDVLFKEAKSRWLKPEEVLFVLQNHEKFGLTEAPPQKPPSK